MVKKIVNEKLVVVVAEDGTGDFSSIQDAVDSLPPRSGRISIKDGLYRISSTISVTSSNVSLEGVGSATKIFVEDGSNADAITVGDGVKAYSNIVIRNIQIDGNGANQTSAGHGIVFKGNISHSKIEDCWIHSCYGDGIHLEGGSNNNTILNNSSISSFRHCGILLDGCKDNLVSTNQFNSNYSSGIRLDNVCSNNVVVENQCNSNGLEGIDIVQSTSNTVSNNQCNSNVRHGIYSDGSNDNTINGNTCIDNDVNNTLTYDGIHLKSSSNNLVVGNRCQDKGVCGLLQRARIKEVKGEKLGRYSNELRTDARSNIEYGKRG